MPPLEKLASRLSRSQVRIDGMCPHRHGDNVLQLYVIGISLFVWPEGPPSMKKPADADRWGRTRRRCIGGRCISEGAPVLKSGFRSRWRVDDLRIHQLQRVLRRGRILWPAWSATFEPRFPAGTAAHVLVAHGQRSISQLQVQRRTWLERRLTTQATNSTSSETRCNYGFSDRQRAHRERNPLSVPARPH